MNEIEKTGIAWVIYTLAVIAAATYSIATVGPNIVHVMILVFGTFLLGWKACRLDVEHLKAKTATPEPKPSGPDEEEKKWRSMLVKKGPFE